MLAVKDRRFKRKSCNKPVFYCSLSFSSAYEVCGCIGDGHVSSDRRSPFMALGLVRRIHIAIGHIGFVKCNQGIAGRFAILGAPCSIPCSRTTGCVSCGSSIDSGIATSRSDYVPRSLDWVLSCCTRSMPKIRCRIIWAGIALRVSSLRAGNKVCFAWIPVSAYLNADDSKSVPRSLYLFIHLKMLMAAVHVSNPDRCGHCLA
jgi:hypothetical protein